LVSVLVSVRNVEEAKIALKAGVDLIDLKEPEKAAMGMVDLSVVSLIQKALTSNLSLSMACGELSDVPKHLDFLPTGISFYKFGLSNCKSTGNWVHNLLLLKEQVLLLNESAFIVPVLYGDYLKANSIKPFALLEMLLEHSFFAIMIDTWVKDGSSVLDWITVDELSQIQNKCEVNLEKITRVIREGVKPAWFGFRGAVCKDRSRNKTIDFGLTLDLIAGVKRLNSLGSS
jgi:(5-formylfuran-3-yl)methyl phosphate synthase